jgi:hypothetical protein
MHAGAARARLRPTAHVSPEGAAVTEEPSGDILARGPIHKLTIEFELNRFRGELLPELDRLKELGIIRIIDLLAVRKDRTGAFMVMMASDLAPDEAVDFGSSVGKLIGLGIGGREGAEIGAKLGAEMLADGHVFEADEAPAIAERMRPDTTYVIALLEHTWSIPLRSKIDRVGGSVIEDEWIGIADLISIGYAADQRSDLQGGDDTLEEESAG